jgi:phosphocarrier protein FPr
MASLVLICHSAKLAEGVRELAEQITQRKVQVFATGGVDEHTLGTNPDQVRILLEAADNPEGVLVLMDLGSSVLGVEMVLSEWPPERRERVVLCEGPLVEGAVAAASQLAAGASLKEAAQEARGALGPKAAQLGITPAVPVPPVGLTPAGREVSLKVTNPMGLHARPAALFVRTAARFQSQITIRNATRGAQPASAKSTNGVALIDARQGDEIVISAEGADAEQALAALQELVISGFGEGELPREAPGAPTPPSSIPGAMKGVPASPGVALGPACVFKPIKLAVEQHRVDDPSAEWARLLDALAKSRREVAIVREQTAAQLGEYQASIFDAHLMFLDDPAWVDPVREHIFHEKMNAEAAWQIQVEELAGRYEKSDNSLLQARAADIRDVGGRVLRHLTGEGPLPSLPLDHPAVIIAVDLAPSETVALDAQRTLAICTARGGPTSHTAILARRLGVPAVVGLGDVVLNVSNGTFLAVDGELGQVVIAADPNLRAEFQARREAWLSHRRAVEFARLEPAVTKDGHRIEVVANIGSVPDARTALEAGAEGVGLLRTEFLYLDRRTAPSEDEQVQAYGAIFAVLGKRPVIVRTFDVGGDKQVPYMDLGVETNPFLGWRGVRPGLEQVGLLKTQLRAILRAAVGYDVGVMFPMVATVEEVRRIRSILDEARVELQSERLPVAESIQVGIMIEIPSAALMANAMASLVDFFSVGTNDLTQYTLAADRTNPKTARLADALHPAVLRLIRNVVDAAHSQGKWVGVCGELAGDPLAVPILLGLGVDELSVNSPAIPEVKVVVRRVMISEGRALAESALKQDTAEAVRALVQRP